MSPTKLAELVTDPDQIEDVDPEEVPDLLSTLEAVRCRLQHRYFRPPAPEPTSPPEGEEQTPQQDDVADWRTKLWTCPADTRLRRKDLEEALGVNDDWIYRRTQASADDPIPHRKLAGSLCFRAGEVRAWVREQEEVLVAGPSDASKAELETVAGTTSTLTQLPNLNERRSHRETE